MKNKIRITRLKKLILFCFSISCFHTVFATGDLQVAICPAGGLSGCSGTYISNVTIVGTTLNNPSLCANGILYPTNGISTGTIQQGSTYEFSVTTSGALPAASAIVGIWIDYNQNNLLDYSEFTQITMASTKNVADTVNITIPINAALGQVRLRVRCRDAGNVLGPTDPCTIFISGETEDYTLTVSSAPPCTAPLNSGITQSTDDSVCAINPFVLSLSGATIATGLTYQWQSSANGVTWTDVIGATSMNYPVNSISSSLYYHCIVSCGAANASSTAILITALGAEYFDFTAAPTLHFYENFDNWKTICDDHEVPFDSLLYSKNYWKTTPEHGNQSWRRQDQGFSTGGWTGVNSSFNLQPHAGTGAACYHTYAGTGLFGTMDLYLNCTNFFFIDLSFFYFKNNNGIGAGPVDGYDTVSVQISTNGGATFSTVSSYVSRPADVSPLWQNKVLQNIHVWNSPTCILRFRDSGDIFQSNDTGIDDVSIDGILGTGNAESDNTLLAILPNPSNGKVQIQCGNKNFSKTKVQLIDATGRIVYSENLQNTSAFWTQTMDWSAQPKGVYFVKLISDAKVFTQKIVLE